MSRYFHYKSIADLAAESVRLRLDLRFSDDFAPLFRPVRIGKLTARNSLCIQPMEGCDGTLDGQPGELTFRRWRRFGAGGAGLIWGEAAAVVPEGRANPRQLLVGKATLPGLAGLVRESMKSNSGTIVGLQLTHSGRYSICPQAFFSDDDLKRLVDHYVAGAHIAARAGFHFVDVKQCHGYLLNELLGARSRPGSFGGSLENRTRLGLEIVTAIRAALPALIVATRISVFDGLPFQRGPNGAGVQRPHKLPLVDGWGVNLDDPSQPDLSEPIWYLRELVKRGVQLVNVTLGNPYTSPHLLRPFEYPPPDGYEPPEHPLVGVDRHFRLAAEIQNAAPEVPVVGSGYSYLQEFLPHAAAANLRDRRCTFAGVGRASLPQPDFTKEIQQTGRLDRKRVCRTFSYCTALMRSKNNELGQFATGCPPFDKEVYGPIWRECQELTRKATP